MNILALALTFYALLPNQCGAQYQVKPGDTLWHISQECGTTVDALRQTNGINGNLIYAGQVLNIPNGTTRVQPSTQAPVPTLAGLKGLAMVDDRHPEDLQALGVSWFYYWGWCDVQNCTPMVREMQLPPSCPPYLLVGNEPNSIETHGHPIMPNDAVNAVREIEKMCPQTRLIVGNVAMDKPDGGSMRGYDWINNFLAGYYWATGKTYSGIIGVHCYVQMIAQWCIDKLNEVKTIWHGETWLTEFSLMNALPGEYQKMVNYARSNFARWAGYTNREIGESADMGRWAWLVNDDGGLTENGRIFAGS